MVNLDSSHRGPPVLGRRVHAPVIADPYPCDGCRIRGLTNCTWLRAPASKAIPCGNCVRSKRKCRWNKISIPPPSMYPPDESVHDVVPAFEDPVWEMPRAPCPPLIEWPSPHGTPSRPAEADSFGGDGQRSGGGDDSGDAEYYDYISEDDDGESYGDYDGNSNNDNNYPKAAGPKDYKIAFKGATGLFGNQWNGKQLVIPPFSWLSSRFSIFKLECDIPVPVSFFYGNHLPSPTHYGTLWFTNKDKTPETAGGLTYIPELEPGEVADAGSRDDLVGLPCQERVPLPGGDGSRVCGRPVRAPVTHCRDKSHWHYEPHAVCAECSDRSKSILLSADAAQIRLREVLGARAYACSDCLDAGVAERAYFEASGRPVWGFDPPPPPPPGQDAGAPAPGLFNTREKNGPAPCLFGTPEKEGPTFNFFNTQKKEGPTTGLFGTRREDGPVPCLFGPKKERPVLGLFGTREKEGPVTDFFGTRGKEGPVPGLGTQKEGPGFGLFGPKKEGPGLGFFGTPREDKKSGFRGPATPVWGCGCTKLLATTLCQGHRLMHAESWLDQAALMNERILSMYGRRVCPFCQRGDRLGVDAYAFRKREGGEGHAKVAWACLVCQEFVVAPKEHAMGLLPGMQKLVVDSNSYFRKSSELCDACP